MGRHTYYVPAEHTGRKPNAVYGSDLSFEQKQGDDWLRITLPLARAMAAQRYDKRPGGAADAWPNAAGKAVLRLAGLGECDCHRSETVR